MPTISYGPPGKSGVNELMRVGDYVFEENGNGDLLRLAKPGAVIAAGVWVFAYFTERKALRRGAFAAALGFTVIKFLARR